MAAAGLRSRFLTAESFQEMLDDKGPNWAEALWSVDTDLDSLVTSFTDWAACDLRVTIPDLNWMGSTHGHLDAAASVRAWAEQREEWARETVAVWLRFVIKRTRAAVS